MSRIRTSHPILNLEQVDLLAHAQSPAHEYFHLFGIFKKEHQHPCGTCWTLFDEYKEIVVKLNGDLSTYLRPKPGDIVRVHRARVNQTIKLAEILVSKNVVIWRAFDEDPEPKTSAKQATITDQDKERCIELMHHQTSKITRIHEMSSQSSQGTTFLTLAGRLEERIMDSFGHIEIKFSDGTGDHQMRVFAKKSPIEDDTHFLTVRDLQKGDYFIASNVKFDGPTKKLNLSANHLYGRSLRPVAKRSILGIVLTAALNSPADQPGQRDHTNDKQDCADSSSLPLPREDQAQAEPEPSSGRRRSPRLLSQQLKQQNASQISSSSIESQKSSIWSQQSSASIPPALSPSPQPQPYQLSPSNTRPLINNNNLQQSNSRPAAGCSVVDSPPNSHNKLPSAKGELTSHFTRLADIKQKNSGYDFHNIVGQVRAEPKLNPTYGNCILQIFDGSLHKHNSFYTFEVERVVPGCVLVQIYSKQKESDTDEHIEKAKNLKEGELILVKNVKTSFRDGRLKLELSANKLHDKSINVIDKDSEFGRRLSDMVENPIVEGLDEQIDSFSEGRHTQATDNFIMEIS